MFMDEVFTPEEYEVLKSLSTEQLKQVEAALWIQRQAVCDKIKELEDERDFGSKHKPRFRNHPHQSTHHCRKRSTLE